MKLFFQNAKNQNLSSKSFSLHSDFKTWQWMVLFTIWIILFPLCIPLWFLCKLLIGVWVFSGSITFWLTHMLFKGIPDSGLPFRWQCVRAYINNCIAVKLPHWNGPFRKFLFKLSCCHKGYSRWCHSCRLPCKSFEISGWF
jgi:hypothetical protein